MGLWLTADARMDPDELADVAIWHGCAARVATRNTWSVPASCENWMDDVSPATAGVVNRSTTAFLLPKLPNLSELNRVLAPGTYCKSIRMPVKPFAVHALRSTDPVPGGTPPTVYDPDTKLLVNDPSDAVTEYVTLVVGAVTTREAPPWLVFTPVPLNVYDVITLVPAVQLAVSVILEGLFALVAGVTLRLEQEGAPPDFAGPQLIMMLPLPPEEVSEAHPLMVTVCALTPAEPNIDVASSAAPHNNPRKANFMCFSQMKSITEIWPRDPQHERETVAARATYATFKPADSNMLLA
jgi:hypothetical protein